MHYVYILRSENEAGRFYVGETSDLRERLSKRSSRITPPALHPSTKSPKSDYYPDLG